MSLRQTLLDTLTGDAALRTKLAGGVYDTPIERKGLNEKPDAFDMERGGMLKPCAVLTMETATPTGPQAPGFQVERAFFSIYIYARSYTDIDEAQACLKALLDYESADLGDGEGFVYEFRHVEDSADLLAAELDNVPMRYSRFSAVTHG